MITPVRLLVARLPSKVVADTIPEALISLVTRRPLPVLKVNWLLSEIAPEVPARTTRPEVRSLTVADDMVVSPPEMSAPPSTSRAPPTVAPAPTLRVVASVNVTVEIPDTLIAAKFAPAPPPSM